MVIISKQMRVPSLGKAASDYAVGESVFLNVNGTATEFLVVHQGNPDATLYDASCEGTWLLMKECPVEKRAWDSSDNDYENSDIHAYLNGTFFNMFDSSVQSIISQVKIPYVKGTGRYGSVASGTNGLSTKIFLLNGYEVGWTSSNFSYFMSGEGSKLDYFLSGTDDSANAKRVAYEHGTTVGQTCTWWLRSPYVYSGTDGQTFINAVKQGGGRDNLTYAQTTYIRPALILPYDTKFDEETNMIKG